MTKPATAVTQSEPFGIQSKPHMALNRILCFAFLLWVSVSGCRSRDSYDELLERPSEIDAVKHELNTMVSRWLAIDLQRPREESARAFFEIVGGSRPRDRVSLKLNEMISRAPKPLSVRFSKIDDAMVISCLKTNGAEASVTFFFLYDDQDILREINLVLGFVQRRPSSKSGQGKSGQGQAF